MRLLLCVPILGSLPEPDRTALFSALKLVSYPEGKTIVGQGSPPQSFYIIKEGGVVIQVTILICFIPRKVIACNLQRAGSSKANMKISSKAQLLGSSSPTSSLDNSPTSGGGSPVTAGVVVVSCRW
jgi:hypothetical protein